MTARNRIRDQLRSWVPWWLADRYYSSGKTVGFRFLWTVVGTLDAYMEYVLQGLQSAWPGKGTPTALALIGRSRGILRGQADTDEQYAAKLRQWLSKWAGAGTQRQVAVEIHEYLGNAPRVRVVNRAGHMVTVAADGTVTTDDIAWDWDSVSNPERAGYWSEMWIIVYPTQWAVAADWGVGTWGDDGFGFGHEVSRVEVDAIKAIVAQWKCAHTRVRNIIWTSDAALFDPSNMATMPNGNWGEWAVAGVATDRNVTTCRYWDL